MARHLPPEWAPQGAVLLIWPHAQSDWARDLERAEAAFAALALAITRFETVVLACHDEATRARALERLEGVGCPRAALTTVLVPSDDTWARDIAPLAVVDDGQPLLVECRFNGWGGKYPHARDADFARHLLDAAGFATIGRERADLVLEGGAIDTDGAGSVLVNRNTVLDSARNPGLDGASVERLLRRHFGIERTLWIDVPPLPGDDTDGHIDTLARFTDVDTIAHAAPHDEADPAAPALATLRAQLEALRTADGDPYRDGRAALPHESGCQQSAQLAADEPADPGRSCDARHLEEQTIRCCRHSARHQ